jgi:CNT family concentrative nucleoside transporter
VRFIGYLLSPVAWCLGVDWQEATAVGRLLGVKTVLNEFMAYVDLEKLIAQNALSERSAVISTFALCGFANFGSIGVTLGGIGALAPSRRPDLARLALPAMVGGALSSFMTATIAGMLL